MDIHALLKQHWGYTAFRPQQEEIIQSVLQGADTLALLPTGGGKSICYQVPGIAMEGMCLVISPLIALMHDQVENLKKRGVSALALTSDLDYRQLDAALENAVHGAYKFLYVSPERLKTELFQARLDRMKINLLAIDEAHCISQWGYDFRPSYLEIAETRQRLPKVPVLALTATATPEVVQDIQKRLHFQQGNVFQAGFTRENLVYAVRHTENKEAVIDRLARQVPGSGIVYCSTRKSTVYWARFLASKGHTSAHYHAGLDTEQRAQVQQQWIRNEVRIICATNAFGMGIDKPDVRFVAHADVPESPEAYFQEAGRAGRDGNKSYALLLWNNRDIHELQHKLALSFPPLKEVKRVYQALGNYLRLAVGSGKDETFDFDLPHFAQQFQLSVQPAYYALKVLEKEGYLVLSEAFHSPSRLRFTVSNRALYDFKVGHAESEALIDTVLRSYGGAFEELTTIREAEIARRTQRPEAEVRKTLQFLHDRNLLEYHPQSNQPKLTLLHARVDERNIYLSQEVYGFLKERAAERTRAMTKYMQEPVCRSQQLLTYFGETDAPLCGTCDVCLAQKQKREKETVRKELEQQLLQLIRTEQKITLHALNEHFSAAQQTLLQEVIREWIDQERVGWDDPWIHAIS